MQKPARSKGEFHTYFVRVSASSLSYKIYAYLLKTITRFRRNFLANFVRADLTDAIINEAIRLTDMYALRGYDAVQLATALAANRKRLSDGLSAIIFVCADSELNTAAQAEGLIVENPNNYP